MDCTKQYIKEYNNAKSLFKDICLDRKYTKEQILDIYNNLSITERCILNYMVFKANIQHKQNFSKEHVTCIGDLVNNYDDKTLMECLNTLSENYIISAEDCQDCDKWYNWPINNRWDQGALHTITNNVSQTNFRDALNTKIRINIDDINDFDKVK